MRVWVVKKAVFVGLTDISRKNVSFMSPPKCSHYLHLLPSLEKIPEPGDKLQMGHKSIMRTDE